MKLSLLFGLNFKKEEIVTVDTTAPVIPSYTASPNPTSGNVVITLSVVESGASTSIA